MDKGSLLLLKQLLLLLKRS